MQIYWTKINAIIKETPEVRTYMLDCPKDFTWEEGSHTHFALEGFNAGDKPNRSLIRHMSISTLPHENSIGITTRIKEQCSEFKKILSSLEVGDEVAIFKTHSNVPLKREDKNVYLLSSGVGLATFRPLVLDYFERADHVNQIHSLNIDSSNDFLFTNIFESAPDKKFTSQFVDTRKGYYEEVKSLSADKEGLFYVVGSDEFLVQNIAVLCEQGIKPEQIMIDKHEHMLTEFLSIDM
ncbi:dihydropteridine reductase [Sporosarcina sp. P12(2017)]|uniref:dihydropteridine reductase n=1 Tax=unclassified Sporosarcina TaxID=2647733 RepID=UPI000C16D543|nr:MULTISPECIES: dihydropteridine reductase [unclassified Sporosarcina]PIC58494.1 dihydropteridine reductase [Sporosarcina sp. P10]PIC61813.1 dihydropteridine reductase [Sporosarcina sp. P12(2017)]